MLLCFLRIYFRGWCACAIVSGGQRAALGESVISISVIRLSSPFLQNRLLGPGYLVIVCPLTSLQLQGIFFGGG